MTKTNIKYSEAKYKQLLKDYTKLLKEMVITAKTNQMHQELLSELAEHMNLKPGKMTPREIINAAKGRITKIHLVN